MTWLVSLFVTSRNALFGVSLPRKIITVLPKHNPIFQASIAERCSCLSKRSGLFRQNPLKVTVKKLNKFELILHKRLLRFPAKFFSSIHKSLFYHVW